VCCIALKVNQDNEPGDDKRSDNIHT